MRRSEILEILKGIEPLETGNDGPTTVFVSAKIGQKEQLLNLCSDSGDYIKVTVGRGLFKRKYKINRNEIQN